MNIEELKRKTETDISEFITKNYGTQKDRKRSFRHPVYYSLKKNDWALESYDIKITLI